MHLLLVEDEDAIRTALARALAQGGHSVAAAASLAEARRLVAERRPDALVSDLKLADGSGLDLARELGLPCTLMSGYGTFDDACAALRLGASDFLTKPVPLRELRLAVERMAARPADGARVVDPDGGETAVSTRGRIARSSFSTHAATWREGGSRIAWESLLTACPGTRQRQILAELLQAVPSGRATVNRGDGRWLAWVRCEEGPPWPADCRRLVEALAAVAHWDVHDCLVECHDA